MQALTDPTLTLLQSLRDEVRHNNRAGRVVLAIDGTDGAGKTTFADAFAEVFAEDGSAVFRASIDGFHRPRTERYERGRSSPEGFYRDSYDYATFRRVLIEPFRDTARGAEAPGFQLGVFDVVNDTFVDSEAVTAPEDAVLIVDGIFLNRPELRGIWNWSLWLDAPPEVTFARMAERDGADPDPNATSNARYLKGQQLYLREARPLAAASVIIDNTDPANPARVYRDFC